MGDGDIDAWDAESPLHAAVRLGRDTTVKLLLQYGGESMVRSLQQPQAIVHQFARCIHWCLHVGELSGTWVFDVKHYGSSP